jgi:hypothetical protein
MVFFIDDILLRSIGISIPPFDMIWLMETISSNAEESYQKEVKKWVFDNLKENSLLYELGEMTREEYVRKNNELNLKLRDIEELNNLNSLRINLLNDIHNDVKVN